MAVTLRRPRMTVWCQTDLELRLRELLCMLCYIDDVDITPVSIIEELVADGMYCPPNVIHGVANLFGNIMPDCVEFHGEVCSVYAQKVHEAGYLQIDNKLAPRAFKGFVERIVAGEFSHGCTEESLLHAFPVPSFQADWTYCYAPDNPAEKWICFDFPREYHEGYGYQPYLRSIRWPAETFEEGFELTKEGYERTQRGIAFPKLDEEAFEELWNTGKKWKPNEELPIIEEPPRQSRWKHLWGNIEREKGYGV